MRNDIDTNYFKGKLEEELVLVEHELKSVGQKNPDNKTDWEVKAIDFADSADENETADKQEEYEENAAILSELEKKLNDIKSALVKIDTGVYGICEVSNEPIEEDRLEANPAARTCKVHMGS